MPLINYLLILNMMTMKSQDLKPILRQKILEIHAQILLHVNRPPTSHWRSWKSPPPDVAVCSGLLADLPGGSPLVQSTGFLLDLPCVLALNPPLSVPLDLQLGPPSGPLLDPPPGLLSDLPGGPPLNLPLGLSSGLLEESPFQPGVSSIS
ncbi:unnamed protein product [Allacma fusca]|uniref:Uncharacterized protein n=1 Tax=Allacma fusca TaxID=39272 RepID=A0A8J2KEH2_9HEXA|nr:unnamed protein product [Allacma fusca]